MKRSDAKKFIWVNLAFWIVAILVKEEEDFQLGTEVGGRRRGDAGSWLTGGGSGA